MNKSEFLIHATSFESCGTIVVTGDVYGLTESLACEARDSIISSGGSAIVYDAETLVAYTHDAYTGKALQFWQPDNRYYAGEYVIPSEMERTDYLVFSNPVDCAGSILQRFRFRCVQTGLSGGQQPPEFSPGAALEGQVIADDQGILTPRNSGYAMWEAEPFSGSTGTVSSKSGLSWEFWNVVHRGASVIIAPKQMNPANALTGDAVTDGLLDLALAERPIFWPHQSPTGKPVREMLPYMVAQYRYFAASDEVVLLKRQVTRDGCSWETSSD